MDLSKRNKLKIEPQSLTAEIKEVTLNRYSRMNAMSECKQSKLGIRNGH